MQLVYSTGPAVYICIYICMYTYIYIYVYIYTCMYIRIYACMYTCIYMHVCTYIFSSIYVWMNLYMYMNIHIYTYMYISIMFNQIYKYIFDWTLLTFFVYAFFAYPFELAYPSYDIRWELFDKPSIISFFPCTCPTTEFQKILTKTILEQQNEKQNLQILKILCIRNIQPKLNIINFETSANVLECVLWLTLFIETNLKSKCYTSINAHSYKIVMYIQKLHHFCNTSFSEDGPQSGRKYLGNN